MQEARLPKTVALSHNEQLALNGIIKELTEKYPFIRSVILYGSKARGDFLEHSDVDLLFVADSDVARTTRDGIYDIMYDYELAHDVVVSGVFVSEQDFRNKVSPFLIKVRREGIVLWSRE